jgi:hypothetical protein
VKVFLSDECWRIQLEGIEVCNTCVSNGNPSCNGQKIRETSKNELGYDIPLKKVFE